MITLHDDIEQGSEAWHQAREGMYTGSNAALLLKYGARPFSQAKAASFTGSFHTKRGHLLESEAIELYEAISGTTVQHTGYVTNDAFEDCLYSPDGLQDDAVIEVKCFGELKHLALYNGVIPLEVMAQVQFGMMICEKPQAKLLIYNPSFMKKEPVRPDLALKIITIKARLAIHKNMKKILSRKVAR